MAKPKRVFDWYDIKPVCSYGASINMIIGARGLGKTYGFAKEAISRALYKDEQFIYLRRYQPELATSKATFFAAVGVEFPGWEFKVVGANGYASKAVPPQQVDETDSAYKDRMARREWKHICFFIALSVAQSLKSVSFPKVHWVIFDEFIIEKGTTPYLPNEATALLNFFVTVDRNQERVKMFLLANAVSIMNPYTIEWDIDLTKLPEISTHRKGFLLIHLPESKNYSDQVRNTPLGQFIEGTQFGAFAMDNQFGDAHTSMIRMKDPKATYKYTLETRKGTFSVWYLKRTQEWFVQTKRPKLEWTLTLVAENMSEEKTYVMYSDKLLGMLRTSFRHGRVFADSAKTRNAFIDVFRR